MTRTYGLNNTPEDPTRCIEAVSGHYIIHKHQCSRKRGHGPGGLYCKQHGKKAQAKLEKAK